MKVILLRRFRGNSKHSKLVICVYEGEIYTFNLKLSTTLTFLYIIIGLSLRKKLYPPSHNTKDNLHRILQMVTQMLT